MIPDADHVHDLALVESALSLHARALDCETQHSRQSSVVLPCLIMLTGKPADRARAEPSALDLALAPAFDSSWRSESVAHGALGGRIQIDLVTSTPKPATDTVIDLRAASQCAHRPTGARVSGRHAARTAALRRLGEVDRRLSDRRELAAGRIFSFGMSEPQMASGASALASLWTVLTMNEAAFPLSPLYAPEPCLRRLHVFDEIPKGMTCAILTEVFRGGAQSPATQSIRSGIRRIPDGTTLAVFETVLR